MNRLFVTRGFGSGRRTIERSLLLVIGIVVGVFLAVGTSVSARQAAPTRLLAATGSVPVTNIETLREKAIAQVSPAIVEVQNVGIGLGSGVIIQKDGYIVTNYHVVAKETKLLVVLPDGRSIQAKLLGSDAVDDLAVIRISAKNLPTVPFGDSSKLRVGQTVLAIGNPLGIANTVTDGIVSALNRTVTEGQQTNGSILHAIQTNAAINPGNSGGALINLGGQVIGIPTLTAIDPQFNAPASGVGFAIPSNTVQNITAQLIKYGKVVQSGRAAVGISAADITPQLASQYNLPVDHGVLVAQVVSGGPAAKAGLQAGVIIVKVNSTAVGSLQDFLTALANQKPGTTVTITAVTPNGQKTYKVTLGQLNVNGNG
jgi:S1-C subfamily serine protease